MDESKPNEGRSAGTASGTSSARMDWSEEQQKDNPASAAFRAIPLYLSEIKAYAGHYMSAKVDGIKASIKRIVGLAIIGFVGLLVVVGIVFSAAFLLLAGLADLIGSALGGRIWLGQLIVGAFFLAVILGATLWVVKKMSAASRKQTEKKYEGRHIQQVVDFGRDVHERAREAKR
jgi:CHASE3 domain sensor protein